MKINNIFFNILEEQPSFDSKTKPIVDAIKKRNPLTFYYSGPRKPKKDSVVAGGRFRAEIVAMGLSKKGNLIVRAWVDTPSRTKTGFQKGNWRTFMVKRMSNITVFDDRTFDVKRPGYKEGDDKSMTVTYVKSSWTKTPEVKQKELPKPTPTKPEPVKPVPTKPEKVEPKKSEELPQPKPEKKPEPPKKEVEPVKPEVTPEPEKPETTEKLPEPKPEEKPKEPEEKPEENEKEKLQESLIRFKSLISYRNKV
jgi:hypothetical protein